MSDCRVTITGTADIYRRFDKNGRWAYELVIEVNCYDGVVEWRAISTVAVDKGDRVTVTGDWDYEMWPEAPLEQWIRNAKVQLIEEE